MTGAEARAATVGATHMAFLALMAKAGALDAIGENGAATNLVQQHLNRLECPNEAL